MCGTSLVVRVETRNDTRALVFGNVTVALDTGPIVANECAADEHIVLTVRAVVITIVGRRTSAHAGFTIQSQTVRGDRQKLIVR